MGEKFVRGVRWVRVEPRWTEMEAWTAPRIGGRIALCRTVVGLAWEVEAGGCVKYFTTFDECSRFARTKRNSGVTLEEGEMKE